MYRTTSLKALYREAGIAPVLILLEEIHFRKALLLWTLDQNHPLKKRTYSNVKTRLTQAVSLVLRSVDARAFRLQEETVATGIPTQTNRHDMQLYTDGSVTNEGRAGGGYVAYQAGKKFLANSFIL